MLHVHQLQCFMYTSYNALCTPVTMLYLHQLQCFMYTSFKELCTPVSMLYVHHFQSFMYTSFKTLCTPVLKHYVHQFQSFILILQFLLFTGTLSFHHLFIDFNLLFQVHIEFNDEQEHITLEGPPEEVEPASKAIVAKRDDLVSITNFLYHFNINDCLT